MNATQRVARDNKIKAAIQQLIHQPAFGDFMVLVRDLREVAIRESCMHDTVASERASQVAKGYVRCYTEILDYYDELAVAAETAPEGEEGD